MKRVEYSQDGKTAYFDGYKFRRDAKTGYYLATKPTYQGKRERLHCYVWRYFNGPVPEGFHVHHVDENKSHNDIENLICIPGELHAKYHLSEYVENNYSKMIKNLNENVRPKASEWHRSEAGRDWHREHYAESLGKIRPVLHTCKVCGKEYFSKQKGNSKFCSNNCKSAYRRKLGVDNETRICKVCGKEFVTNKYSKQKCCSGKCAGILRWDKRNQDVREAAGL